MFFVDNIKNEKGESALDIGTGTGYLAKVLTTRFDVVVATDISFDSLKLANSSIDNCICCNGASALNMKFDLIVCNLPYLPSNELVDRAVDGGTDGKLVAQEIIESTKNVIKDGGKFFLLTSSLADYDKIIKHIESYGFKVRIVANKKMFFEELILIEAIK